MTSDTCIGLGHWFVYGYYAEGEHEIRTYIGFDHWLEFVFFLRQTSSTQFIYTP